jgi:putative tryptophan/tyrosine transport system substrate-binding protein
LAAAALGALWHRPAAAARVWRVGILEAVPRGDEKSMAQRFVNAMRELGYAEGREVEYLHRHFDGDSWDSQRARLAVVARELVRSRPDAIVTAGTFPTKGLQLATTTIPIVTNAGDPVGAGFAKSLVRPGGNITGIALATPELSRKGLEQFKSIIPGNWALAIVYPDDTRDVRSLISAVEEGARACGIPIRAVSFKGQDARQADRALASMRSQGIRVLVAWDVIPGIAEEDSDLLLATKYGLATIAASEGHVERGALMAYSPEGERTEERKAFQLVRILRGTPPGEIPFETPTTFRMTINRKSAKILGLTIPREILLIADKVYD